MGHVRLPARVLRLNVENAVSNLFDFNTPGENDLLLEGAPVSNVVAASRLW